MSQKLPHNGFELVSSCKVSKLQNALMNGYDTAITYFETIWINDPQREYILEVDLFYDYILHDRDDDFPMALENIDIDKQNVECKTTSATNKIFWSYKFE